MAPVSQPTKMKSLVHVQKPHSLSLVNDQMVPIPAGNEHLLNVDAVAITSGELLWPRPAELNTSCPGTDMAGEVVSAPRESKFKAGDQIYMRTTYPRAGSAREYSIGLEGELALRPRTISAVEAAAVPVSALTAWQALFVHAGLPLPSNYANGTNGANHLHRPRILVNGASGAVGLWMTQLAHYAACIVFATASAKNADLVRDMGADEIIDYTQESIFEWSKRSGKVDVLLDTVGGSSLEDAWHAVVDAGRVLTIVPTADMSFRTELMRPKGIGSTVEGKFFIMEPNGQHLDQITKLIEEGSVKPVIDSVYPLEDYQKAFDRVNSRRAVGKVILKVSKL